jgi:glucose/mannose-6-phosphate isomerase
MDLDDLVTFNKIDRTGLLAQIDGLSDQLYQAVEWGRKQTLPAWPAVHQILLTGSGSPVLGGELLAAWAQTRCPTPLLVNRGYDLPAWAGGPGGLVIVCAHSGEEEVALATFSQAMDRKCRCLVLTTGGSLADLAGQAGSPVWPYPYSGPATAGMGWFFGLALAALVRLDVLEDPEQELELAISNLRRQQEQISAGVPVVNNPAKRLAGQLYGRSVAVFGSGQLAPAARHWKNQLNRMAKVWGQFETLPEADYNTLEGNLNPEDALRRLMVIFLRSSMDHPRNQLRADLTRQSLMLEGIGTDFYLAPGDSALGQQWAALHFGDYLAYYLAMAYGVDPAALPAFESLDRTLKGV